MKVYVYINGVKCELLHIADRVVDNKCYDIVVGRTESGTIVSMAGPSKSIHYRIMVWENEEAASIYNILEDYLDSMEDDE